VSTILEHLDAAQSVEDMRLPVLRLHALKGDLKGYYAVTVKTNWRIIFRVAGGCRRSATAASKPTDLCPLHGRSSSTTLRVPSDPTPQRTPPPRTLASSSFCSFCSFWHPLLLLGEVLHRPLETTTNVGSNTSPILTALSISAWRYTLCVSTIGGGQKADCPFDAGSSLEISTHRIWICLAVLALAGVAAAQTAEGPRGPRLLAQHPAQADDSIGPLDDPNWLGPFVTTPIPIVDAVLELAQVGDNDLVYDLGSGDGRIILAAAQKFQARSVGIEWNPSLCEEVSSVIAKLGLEDRVKVIQGDIFDQDISPATVVTGYLLPKSWERLAPILERQLASGTRVVSVNHLIPGWQVVEKRQLRGESRTLSWNLYLYRIR
jgi:hypothetical protein